MNIPYKVSIKQNPSCEEVFEYVKAHLLKQGKKCGKIDYSEELTCLYRNFEENTMCAAGCLFNDEDYEKHLESNPISFELIQKACGIENIYRDENDMVETIRKLQRVHDYKDVSKWPEILKDYETFKSCQILA